jgi:hypothetical protein
MADEMHAHLEAQTQRDLASATDAIDTGRLFVSTAALHQPLQFAFPAMNRSNLCFALILVFAPAVLGALPSRAADQPSVAPRVEVSVESELKTLAQGYAAAFSEFPSGPKYVWVRRGEEVVLLGNARSLRASGGFLVIETDGGPTFLVSAGDVVHITNETPRPKKP